MTRPRSELTTYRARRTRYRLSQPDTVCKDDTEDEFHFILKCPTYQNFISKYIKPYYVTRPSVFTLVQLWGTENVKELGNLGKFLINAYKLRENFISV